MTVEVMMLEPTHGEDDRPSGGRCVDILGRLAGRMQEHDRCRLPSPLRPASLQVSRDIACQQFNSTRIEGCLALDDTGANRRVPPQYGRRVVSKPNFLLILHPAIGKLGKQSMDLHPSVGSFKKARCGIGGARKVET